MGNGDDLIYLFPILMGTFRPLSHEDLVFSERFIKLLTNFATDGKPSLTMESGKEILKVALCQKVEVDFPNCPKWVPKKLSWDLKNKNADFFLHFQV